MATKHIKRVYYPEGVAPFGEMSLLRPTVLSKNNSRYNGPDPALTPATKLLIKNAWLNSDWLASTVTDESVRDRLQSVDWPIIDQLETSLYRAYNTPRSVMGWFAVRGAAALSSTNGFEHISLTDLVGLGVFKHDVSGPALKRLVKRSVEREKVYAAFNEIDIVPVYDGTELEVALIDAGVRQFAANRPQQVPTAYAIENDTAYQSTLMELGFVKTGEQVRNGLFGPSIDLPLMEVRFQGTTVDEVQDTIRTLHPWAAKAQINSSI